MAYHCPKLWQGNEGKNRELEETPNLLQGQGDAET